MDEETPESRAAKRPVDVIKSSDDEDDSHIRHSSRRIRQLPVEKGSLPVDNGSLPVENGSLPAANRSLPVEKGSLPVKNGSLPV